MICLVHSRSSIKAHSLCFPSLPLPLCIMQCETMQAVLLLTTAICPGTEDPQKSLEHLPPLQDIVITSWDTSPTLFHNLSTTQHSWQLVVWLTTLPSSPLPCLSLTCSFPPSVYVLETVICNGMVWLLTSPFFLTTSLYTEDTVPGEMVASWLWTHGFNT